MELGSEKIYAQKCCCVNKFKKKTQDKIHQHYPGVYNGGNSIRSSSAGGMRTPLSSCRKYLALALRGDGDRCLEGSVAACGTIVFVPSKLVCDPVRGRRDDEGEMNAGDENCVRGGVKAWDGDPPLLDVLARLDGWPLWMNLLEVEWEGRDWPFEVYFWDRILVVVVGFRGGTVKGFTTSGEGTLAVSLSACDLWLLRLQLK